MKHLPFCLFAILVALVAVSDLSAQGNQSEDDRPVAKAKRPALSAVISATETRVRFRDSGKGTLIDIFSKRGIGRATIRCADKRWPQPLTVRLRLRGLESFRVSNGKVELALAVSSSGDQRQLLHQIKNGREGPQLKRDDPFWMEARLIGGNKKKPMIPLKEGYIEVTLPAALLKENPQTIQLQWIDFYRG